MTDKVFISKENLEKALSFKEKKDVGFFTSIFIVIWLIALIPFIFGIIFCSLLVLLSSIPFYFIDQFIIRRIKNAKTE
jgi:uncharacterized membrane protein